MSDLDTFFGWATLAAFAVTVVGCWWYTRDE